MYKILAKDRLNDTVTRMVIDAPAVARKAEAGPVYHPAGWMSAVSASR